MDIFLLRDNNRQIYKPRLFQILKDQAFRVNHKILTTNNFIKRFDTMIKEFNTTALTKLFKEKKDKISSSKSTGVDGINGANFSNNIVSEIDIINRKINNGTYNFSNYKQSLIIKSEDKTRTISIPTQRDKFVLRALYNILKKTYPL